jgi:hypothetical protein
MSPNHQTQTSCQCAPMLGAPTHYSKWNVNALQCWVHPFITPGEKTTTMMQLHQLKIIKEPFEMTHQSPRETAILFIAGRLGWSHHTTPKGVLKRDGGCTTLAKTWLSLRLNSQAKFVMRFKHQVQACAVQLDKWCTHPTSELSWMDNILYSRIPTFKMHEKLQQNIDILIVE